jgi:acyl-CoA synthetase (AMP-forming)/AMP-acid ligase II
MYITGECSCYPAEIERSLSAHPGIAQVAVIGVSEARLGELGMAFLCRVRATLLALKSPGSLHCTRFAASAWRIGRSRGQFAIVSGLPLSATAKRSKRSCVRLQAPRRKSCDRCTLRTSKVTINERSRCAEGPRA